MRWAAKLALGVALLAFAVYFTMYAFRKPFTVARFEGRSFYGTGVDFKTALLISQLLGYTDTTTIQDYESRKRCINKLGTIEMAQT